MAKWPLHLDLAYNALISHSMSRSLHLMSLKLKPKYLNSKIYFKASAMMKILRRSRLYTVHT